MRKLVVLVVAALALAYASPAFAWTWPVEGGVLRPYVFGSDPYAAGQHRGIDVAAPLGAVVRAPVAGVVTFRGFVPSGGSTVTVTTDDGFAVTLQQLGAIEVSKGDLILEGAVVATAGASSDGYTSETHVHLGVRVASQPQGYVDPLSLLTSRSSLLPVEGDGVAPVEGSGLRNDALAGGEPRPVVDVESVADQPLVGPEAPVEADVVPDPAVGASSSPAVEADGREGPTNPEVAGESALVGEGESANQRPLGEGCRNG